MNGETEGFVEGGKCSQAITDASPAAAIGLPFFQRPDRLSFWITTALALVVYWVTLAPEVTLQFSGEFSVAAMYGGVPFPPGFPLWTIHAWLFAHLLPYSNIAWRVAMSSAVAGALTCGVVALIVSRGAALLLEGVSGIRRLAPNAEQILRTVCGCVAGLAFGLDSAFWSKAVVAEVWPLTMLLFATMLCLLMRWFAAPDEDSISLFFANSVAVARQFGLLAATLYGQRIQPCAARRSARGNQVSPHHFHAATPRLGADAEETTPV